MTIQEAEKRIHDLELELAEMKGRLAELRNVGPTYIPSYPIYPTYPTYPNPWTQPQITWRSGSQEAVSGGLPYNVMQNQGISQ